MRGRALLWCSLGLNAVLAAMLLTLPNVWQEAEQNRVQVRLPAARAVASNAAPTVHTVVRRIPFTWKDVESDDYRAYISNLRKIGCPEQTIRDIIIAEVNASFEERRRNEVITTDIEWWKSEADTDLVARAAARDAELDAERRAVLAALLGADWERPGLPPMPQIAGAPEDTVLDARARLQAIQTSSREKIVALLRAAETSGVAPDSTELARIRQEARRELASLLPPDQLEEYLLRYSDTAATMRSELRSFGATQEEFRTIFKLREQFDEQLAKLSGSDPATLAQRAAIEKMRDETIRQSLGSERAPLYDMSQNPVFRETVASIEQAGGRPEQVIPVFQLNQALIEERQRITADRDLTGPERAARLQEIAEQHESALRALLDRPAEREQTTAGQ